VHRLLSLPVSNGAADFGAGSHSGGDKRTVVRRLVSPAKKFEQAGGLLAARFYLQRRKQNISR